jgi:hypothetical protein
MSRVARAVTVVAPLTVLVLSIVLLVSGLLKAIEPEAFRDVLLRQGLLPASWVGPTTTGVWIAEVTGA